MKISLSEDGLELQLAFDGFHYDAFNKAGKMDIWAIAKQCELSGIASLANNFRGIGGMVDHAGVGVFTKIQMYEISSDLYTLASVFSPWQITLRLSYLGKTSFWVEQVLRCKGTEKELVRVQAMLVRIDPKTRRPTSLPEDIAFVKNASKAGPTTAPTRVEFPQTIPDSVRVFSHSTKTLPSDTDTNHHANQIACMKYCMNCASLAAMQGGVLQQFSREIDYYNLTKFVIDYVSEVQAGVVIDVVCWQDSNDFSVLNFCLKNGDKVACRCLGKWQTGLDGNLVEYSQKVISDSAVAAIV